MARNFYLLSRDSSYKSFFSVPLLWCTLKTYYEENSVDASKWTWSDPYIGRKDPDEIMEVIRANPPDVLGLNIYVWNELLLDTFAEEVKREFPNCFIIYGGFQHNVQHNENYFKEKPWVDVVIPGDAYGEIILTEILDQFPIEDFEKIPYVYYTNKNKERFRSQGAIDKKGFNWPSNVFKAQEKHILPRLLENRAMDHTTVIFYHTSRGCPYKCIYCNWGGGTNTKSIKKPFGTVLDEIEWLAGTAKINRIEFSDANFGINSIDIEIARHCVEMNKKYNYPQCVEIEPAKNNLNRVLQIEEILLEQNLMSHHRLTIQTLDPTVRFNIQRVNMPFDAQVKGLRHLQSVATRPLPLYIEAILGLPGDSYQATCDEYDLIHQYDIPIGWVHHYGWMLLPDSPAYSPELREKFKIETVKRWINQNPKLKDGFTISDGDALNLLGSLENKTVETVVGTYSYSKDEWARMFRLSNFTVAAHIVGINTYLMKYIISEHGAKPSEVLTAILETIDVIQDAELKKLFELEKETIYNWLYNNAPFGEVDIDPEFPMLIPHHAFFAFVILLNATAFYKEVSTALSLKYNDSKIIDLGIYVSNILIDYNYTGDRMFSTEYNWLAYFSDNTLLEKGKYNYLIDDYAPIAYSDKITMMMDYYRYSVAEALNPTEKVSTTLRLI